MTRLNQLKILESVQFKEAIAPQNLQSEHLDKNQNKFKEVHLTS